MKVKKTSNQKMALKIAEKFAKSIDKLTDKQLAGLINEYSKYDETNCWWLELMLKEAVMKAALESQKKRKRHAIKKNEKAMSRDMEHWLRFEGARIISDILRQNLGGNAERIEADLARYRKC